MSASDKKKFINLCTITFKTFNHKVTPISSRQTLWDFTSISSSDRQYAVCCIPRLKSSKGLITIALKKVPSDTRLVVVTNNFDEKDFEESLAKNYCLTTLASMKDFNDRMMEARMNEV